MVEREFDKIKIADSRN